MRWVIATLGLMLALSISASAQQKGKSLTNDDFPSGQQQSAPKSDKDKVTDKDTEKDKAGDKAGDKEKAKAQEEWQKKYDENQKKVNTLDKQKTQTELSVQELRNKLKNSGGNSQEFDQLSRQLKESEDKLKDLNSQYSEAQKSSTDLKTEADGKGYKAKVDEPAKADKNGKPNPQYYSQKNTELSDKQKLASEKVQLYQSRINEARQRAYQSRQVDPSRVGSAYYTDPEVKKSMEEAQTELQKAQEELQQTNEKLEKLRREARSSGVDIR